ncbi:MAG: NADH-ubiquinone oxidoreductase-F iron-sulfur binding region domain-containing protein [Acidimicrobiales bacterium]
MSFQPRVLPLDPIANLANYRRTGGGNGLEAAREVDAQVVIDEVEASGLRGRGGAGFPTGIKWRTVAENASDTLRTTVVVNAAEGEPGTLKDRAILGRNPYLVVEGALIAAHAVGANHVIIATKASFEHEVQRLHTAIADMAADGWLGEVTVDVYEGPDEYLYGEETALLEVLAGRRPFPRVTPPYRRGYVEVVEDDQLGRDGGSSAAHVDLAGPGGEGLAPPALVNNVETVANVPAIVARGAAWFREVGTQESPGSLVVTVSGSTERDGVAEVPMGTTLAEAIDAAGGGLGRGSQIAAILNGSVSAALGPEHIDTPLTYEDFERIGSALGSAGFVVHDQDTDMVALAAGVSRFLAVESCGQCTPCKGDGLVMADVLARLAASEGSDHDLKELASRVDTVTDEARCYLAQQHQQVIGSLIERFPDQFAGHADRTAMAAEPVLFAEFEGIEGGVASVRRSFAEKKPDWSHDKEWSGKWPAEQADQRVDQPDD